MWTSSAALSRRMRLILRARRSLAGCSWNRGWVMPVVKVGSLPKQRSAMGQSRRALCWPFAKHCKTIEKARLNNVGTTGHLAWLHLLDQIWRHFLVRVGWSWMALSDSLSGKPLRDTWDVTTRVGDYKWSFYENRKTSLPGNDDAVCTLVLLWDNVVHSFLLNWQLPSLM